VSSLILKFISQAKCLVLIKIWPHNICYFNALSK